MVRTALATQNPVTDKVVKVRLPTSALNLCAGAAIPKSQLDSRNGAAVNDILRARDGGGTRRGEEGNEVRQFFRPGRVSDRDAAE
jgi:hypothetical protein